MSLVTRFKRTGLYRRFFGHKKFHFITGLPEGATVLDIGCGNHSPSIYKQLNASIHYYGVDIAEYNMDETDYESATELFFFDRNVFASSIKAMNMHFDCVISAHNLEHTDKPDEVIEAMIVRLKKGGQLYLSFPTEKSISFPKRKGTLNFYDDDTHNQLPNYNHVCAEIEKYGGKIVFRKKRYRQAYGFIKGALQEPLSAITRKAYLNTWSFWGFETVIIAEKTH